MVAAPCDCKSSGFTNCKITLSNFCLVIALCIHFHSEDWVDAMTLTALRKQTAEPEHHPNGTERAHTWILTLT